MADFEIIEADFQQFYNLDVSKLGFRRYARLLLNLPTESRFLRQYIESKDWTWDKEVQSRILLMLDVISCQITNMNKKKGQRPRKPSDQFQPDYVKSAKNKAKNTRNITDEEMEDLEAFFNKHNSNIKTLDKGSGHE